MLQKANIRIGIVCEKANVKKKKMKKIRTQKKLSKKEETFFIV